jgi:hypothetical protein
MVYNEFKGRLNNRRSKQQCMDPVTFSISDFVTTDALLSLLKSIATPAGLFMLAVIGVVTTIGVGAGLSWKASRATVKAIVR